MDKWEIQQRIRNLEWRKDSLQAEITKLEAKKERINLEHSRKIRQMNKVSSFHIGKRTNAGLLIDGVEGVAISKAVERFGNIYGTANEEKITSNLRNAQFYLKKNCEKIDEKIEDARADISSINWQIYSYKKDLENMESEVQ